MTDIVLTVEVNGVAERLDAPGAIGPLSAGHWETKLQASPVTFTSISESMAWLKSNGAKDNVCRQMQRPPEVAYFHF